jgi:Zn-dependent peptidase ImmA (M78 family)
MQSFAFIESCIAPFCTLHNMHAAIPVNIQPIYDHFNYFAMDLGSNNFGSSMAYKQSRLIIVNSEIPRVLQRSSAAHGASHHLLGHLKSEIALFCSFTGWMLSAVEREADDGAAYLLMPKKWVVYYYLMRRFNIPDLAGEFDVSEEIVRTRLSMDDITEAIRELTAPSLSARPNRN